MNIFKYKIIIRHLIIKTNHQCHNQLVKPVISSAVWTFKRPQTTRITSYYAPYLLSYYLWNLLFTFKPNAQKIYITKMNTNLNILQLLNFTTNYQTLSLIWLNQFYTQIYKNYTSNLTPLLLLSNIYNNNTNNINKLNFAINLNAKFNLKKLFWFDKTISIKSKYFYSKLNLI